MVDPEVVQQEELGERDTVLARGLLQWLGLAIKTLS